MRDPEEIVLALRVADPALAERLSEILGAVPGLRLAAGGEPADAAIQDEGATPPEAGTLTTREREVLGLLTEGASNKAIARRLGISVHTAKFHVGRVIDKLDATGRTDAVAHAARTGLIHL
ncbi:transcriptional regulatory protein [Rubellimicrobium mesophilum DSM 19309]|uniref:Transcriptional regulatory protein n=1 Tax=Rubellimicrobium mesophilum DSM 19309 TaxID=442562 RepID=A0A017HF25_9RHOB|nr:helix-turn-helix transcriptional regulator [Rubellimicrobium mesophilum]EYD72915.1 transcriptional regulatory protein [Rubellimicrobium mesophilum DSM 19309]